jgi:hypothetical protein
MNSSKDIKFPEFPKKYATINDMKVFTPDFLLTIGGMSPLAPLIDNALLEDMLHGGNGGSLTEHLTDGIMDKGYTRSEARQNAEVLEGFVLSGAFSTALTRSTFQLPARV